MLCQVSLWIFVFGKKFIKSTLYLLVSQYDAEELVFTDGPEN